MSTCENTSANSSALCTGSAARASNSRTWQAHQFGDVECTGAAPADAAAPALEVQRVVGRDEHEPVDAWQQAHSRELEALCEVRVRRVQRDVVRLRMHTGKILEQYWL